MNEDLLVEPTITPITNAIIKVIGVGGGGGNAVCQMYREGIAGVRTIVCNTDKKALETAVVPEHLQLGTGLGAGGNPVKGRQYAEESLEAIDNMLDPETKMVFITAGMGGGTGTGASPVIAREAKKRGILTVGIVTLPFLFEGNYRIDKALDGLELLSKEVDALLVINNERLREIYPDLDVLTAFKRADNTLTTAVRCITEIINMHGHIDLDFRDVHTVLKDGGVAVISTGEGEGEGRVLKAIEKALYSPLLNNNDIYRSRRVILNITTNPDPEHALRMEEISEVNNFTAKLRTDVQTKWGLDTDPSLGDRVKITILASGFHLYNKEDNKEVREEEPSAEELNNESFRAERRLSNYPELQHDNHRRPRRHPAVFLYSMSDLEDENLVAEVDASPTAHRSTKALHELLLQAKTQDEAARGKSALTATSSGPAAPTTEPPVTIDFTQQDF